MTGSSASAHRAPPFDPEMQVALAGLAELGLSATVTPDMIVPMREMALELPLADVLAARNIAHVDRVVPGPPGAPDLTVAVFTGADHRPGGPGFFHTHGGGMVLGNRFTGIDMVLEWVELLGGVAVSVEYRLAPEHRDPAPIEDCYAGLVWTAEHAGELGFDPSRLLVVGASAGGGLAAGVALLARDRSGPPLAGQLLTYPMLDDRNDTVSAHQIDGIGVWDRTSNETGWTALLGERRGTDAVSIYAAPARASDLSNLPPARIDVGSAEVFRDEDVDYASRIWACGGVAELHVWPGAFHAFDGFAPDSHLARSLKASRTAWVDRLLGR